MEDRKIGLSLKYKLLLLLTLIPVASLAIYLFIATREFEKDKLPYVSDSAAAMAKSLSQQMRVEVNGFLENARIVVSGFDPVERKFAQTSVELFNKADRLDALILLQRDASGQYQKIGELKRDNDMAKRFVADQGGFQKLISHAVNEGQSISHFEGSDVHLLIAARIGDASSASHSVLIGLYRSSDLYKGFSESLFYRSFLINKSGKIELGPSGAKFDEEFFKPAYTSTLPEGTFESKDKKPQIVGFSSVGVGDFFVTSVVDKKEALKAVDNLIVKSVIFFIGLISLTVIISLLASISLTSTLGELYQATKKVAQGDFDVHVKSDSNDEVGGLADGFNYMASEMSRLIKATKEAARMEGELETVKLVQETLFPLDNTKIGPFKIIGHFEPASECGGDWWNYSMVGDKLYLWIGDATGHGAPAAMVTSAAKAAATIVESLPFISPGKAMEILNKAIHETVKGRILMTFFIASLDLKTGEMIYANASHEPPYLIRGTDKKVTKKNLEPLIEATGARLGDKKDSVYKEAKAQLGEGDAVLFYTDGIVDLKNLEGKAWGERGFIKSICESASVGPQLEARMSNLKLNISNYRQATALVDDITLFMCQFDKEAA
jgi:sigma-B regulation protein RsbU (phosphoserine phosphatase)